jgi:ubiquitin C-terminal hydrolase
LFNSASKKKVRVPLAFKDMLDLTGYAVDPDDGETQYELQDVIVHKGDLADEGHFMIFVKDQVRGGWVKYDDAEGKVDNPPRFDESRLSTGERKVRRLYSGAFL